MSLQILPAVSEGATATPNDKFSITGRLISGETAPLNNPYSIVDITLD